MFDFTFFFTYALVLPMPEFSSKFKFSKLFMVSFNKFSKGIAIILLNYKNDIQFERLEVGYMMFYTSLFIRSLLNETEERNPIWVGSDV